jgi:hypothetical protein
VTTNERRLQLRAMKTHVPGAGSWDRPCQPPAEILPYRFGDVDRIRGARTATADQQRKGYTREVRRTERRLTRSVPRPRHRVATER